MIEFLKQLDTSLFIFLNSLHNSLFDTIFLWITKQYSWIFLYVIILALLVWRYMAVKIQKSPEGGLLNLNINLNRNKWPWLLLSIFFIVFLLTLSDQASVHLFKNVFQRLRPSHEPALSDIIHIPGRRGALYGFVSSHAANSFAVAYFTSGIIGIRWYTWVIYTWAVIFTYSRIYLGVHYPGDCLFGALLGISVGWILLRVWISAGKEWFPSLLPDS
ncbi:MAG: phosphatase PAP2 family protein [Bacteroidales bacterium]